MAQKIRIDPYFWIYGAILFYIIPVNWILAIFAASAFHELFHIILIKYFKGHIYDICLRPSGLIIHAQPMPIQQAVICTLAGPVGSLLLTLFSRIFPLIAICGCIQGIFNLLPLYPLDGGKILFMLFSEICGAKADKVFRCFQIIFVIVLLILASLFYDSIILFVFFLLLLLIKRKSSCKDSIIAVQ